VLKGQSGQPSGGSAAQRFRTSLATAQIALSMVLLVGAGLFTKSLSNVSRVDLGLKPEGVIAFTVSPVLNGYTEDRSRQFFEQVEDRLAALPGVTSATNALVPVLAGNNWGNDVSVEGYPAGPDTDMNSRYNEIGPGYFRTLGVPLLAGREFTRADTLGAPKVAIVNEAFAKKFALGRAVGKPIGDRGKAPDTITSTASRRSTRAPQAIPARSSRPCRSSSRHWIRISPWRTCERSSSRRGRTSSSIA